MKVRVACGVALLVCLAGCATEEQEDLEDQQMMFDQKIAQLREIQSHLAERQGELKMLEDRLHQLDVESSPETLRSLAPGLGAKSFELPSSPVPATVWLRLSGDGGAAEADAVRARAVKTLPPFVVAGWSVDPGGWTLTLQIFRIPEYANAGGDAPKPFVDPATRPLPPEGIGTPPVRRLRESVARRRAELAALEADLRAHGFPEGGFDLNRAKSRLEDLLTIRKKLSEYVPASLDGAPLVPKTLARATVSLQPPPRRIEGVLADGVTTESLHGAIPANAKVSPGADRSVTITW